MDLSRHSEERPDTGLANVHADRPSSLASVLAENVATYWPLAAIVPASAAAIWLARSGGKRRGSSRRKWLGYGMGAVILAGFARWQLSRHFTPKPTYVVESRLGALEVRRYPARVQAETWVATDDFDVALDEGFRRLFGYITGGNGANDAIPMTAPVTSTRLQRHASETIAMTAPVTAAATEGGYRVAFLMPEGRSLDTLPAPEDPRVVLRTVPPHRVACLRWASDYDAKRVLPKKAQLKALAEEAGFEVKGEPEFAGYDAPSTLPFLRRNEVWVAIA